MAKITQQGQNYFVDGKPATPEQNLKIKANIGGAGGGASGGAAGQQTQQALRKLLGQTPEEEFGQFKQRQDYLKSIKTQEQKAAPPPAEQKGKIASMTYWVKRLDDLPKLIFPDGKFDKKAIVDAQLKIPSAKGTEVRRVVMRNIEMILRQETGAAATAGEVERLTDGFMGNLLDNPETFTGKMKDLQGQGNQILGAYGIKPPSTFNFGGLSFKEGDSQKVKVINSQGKSGFIPVSQLDAALKQGFKKAK